MESDFTDRTNIVRSIPFIIVHLICLLAFWVGVSPIAIATCAGLYFIRMFAITGGYHRYFSHRTYQTSRIFQFILGWIGASSAQRGPLWWAAHHRHHHRYSDKEEDIHSPHIEGFWWAQCGWIHAYKNIHPNLDSMKDLTKFPELRAIDKFHMIPPLVLAILVYAWGSWLERSYPAFGTSGPQMLIWGFFISTVILYHCTFFINTLTHIFGKVRFQTGDQSKNSLILALITLGEGWHNNHHRYPGSERQGFYWWEIDITHYVLKVLSWFGIVWGLRAPPQRILDEGMAGILKKVP